MRQECISYCKLLRVFVSCLLALCLLGGCSHTPKDLSQQKQSDQKTFICKEITADQGKSILEKLSIGKISLLTGPNAILVTGSPSELRKAGVVLELIDEKQEFVVKTLGPAIKLGFAEGQDKFESRTLPRTASLRNFPSNEQIAKAVGDIAIGTFFNPPDPNEPARAIIDSNKNQIIAIAPEHRVQEILDVIELGPLAMRKAALKGQTQAVSKASKEAAQESDIQHEPRAANVDDDKVKPSKPIPAQVSPRPGEKSRPGAKTGAKTTAKADSAARAKVIVIEEPQDLADSDSALETVHSHPEPNSLQPSLERSSPITTEMTPTTKVTPQVGSTEDVGAEKAQPADKDDPDQVTIVTPETRHKSPEPETNKTSSEKMDLPFFPNGDDVLELDLPEKISLIQLFDLVGEYLHLDYLYDPELVKDDMLALKLHGKLKGEMRVKDLYKLVESVLKFKGLVMTRHEGNLVTVVPVEDVLKIDPQLTGPDGKDIELGDMVVTHVLELQYIDARTAVSLLDSMNLGVSISRIEGAQKLILTCYAHRIGRIEQLLRIIDNPGKLRKFRFRQLRYTSADTIAEKVKVLAEKLQILPVTVTTLQKNQAQKPGTLPRPAPVQENGGPKSPVKQAVYLEGDVRTNRILMIGYEEQLCMVDGLLDALDVAQQDLRTLKVYPIENVDAEEVRVKLEQLEIIEAEVPTRALQGAPTPKISRSALDDKDGGAVLEAAQVVVLSTTNSLLINAVEDQHARIATVITYVDVVPEDVRILKIYNLEHVDAKEAKRKLEELGLANHVAQSRNAFRAASIPGPMPTSRPATTGAIDEALTEEAQIVILSSTNSLLVNANKKQHERIEAILAYVDAEISEQAIPYEVYFLENQQPEHLAEVLQQIITETVENKEGKIEKVVQKEQERIVIIPEKETFSLIVYATRKNQDWISKLVTTLDRRRPQVLIDVTLVEIRKTDEFDYDLNVISSLPDLAETGGQTGNFVVGENTVVDKLLQPGMRDRFIDLEASGGLGTGFYADIHVNALLEAMQTENYGRILAKPKLLVKNNQTGVIKSQDTTYVTKRSSIPVVSGSAGEQNTLIETAIDFEEYDAGITLEITPHISEVDLLSLDISLVRSDFGTITGEKPPDQTVSDVNTVVTIPNRSTVILGGLLKYNQSKGGTKVPILGDLPILGLLFRSHSHSDVQNNLYVFVRAEIIRPAHAKTGIPSETLQRVSDENRAAFERHEKQFQNYSEMPGLKPRRTDPPKLLEAR